MTTRTTITPRDVWQTVLTYPVISEAAKLAWQVLWAQKCFGRPATIWTSYAEVGAAYGKSERSGRRAVDSLVKGRLVKIIEEKPGRVRLLFWNPLEVVPPGPADCCEPPVDDRPLFAAAADDHPDFMCAPATAGAQALAPLPAGLPPAETDQVSRTPAARGDEPAPRPPAPATNGAQLASADPPNRSRPVAISAEPPADPPNPTLRGFRSLDHLQPSSFTAPALKPEGQGRAPADPPDRRTISAEPPDRSAEPSRIGDALSPALERLLGPTGPQARDAAIERVRRRIVNTVRDRALWPDLVDQVAVGIVDGQIDPVELDDILNPLARRRAEGKLASASSYYNSGAKRLLVRLGLYRAKASSRRESTR